MFIFRLIFGTLYPAYASYKAVKTRNVKEYVSKEIKKNRTVGLGWDRDGTKLGMGQNLKVAALNSDAANALEML